MFQPFVTASFYATEGKTSYAPYATSGMETLREVRARMQAAPGHLVCAFFSGKIHYFVCIFFERTGEPLHLTQTVFQYFKHTQGRSPQDRAKCGSRKLNSATGRRPTQSLLLRGSCKARSRLPPSSLPYYRYCFASTGTLGSDIRAEASRCPHPTDPVCPQRRLDCSSTGQEQAAQEMARRRPGNSPQIKTPGARYSVLFGALFRRCCSL